mgnify:CR=1 FL=1
MVNTPEFNLGKGKRVGGAFGEAIGGSIRFGYSNKFK